MSSRGPAPRPDPGRHLNPWAHGPLIRYLAWLRQTHSQVPLPAPGDDPLQGLDLDHLFVEPTLAASPPGSRAPAGVLGLLEVLEQHPRVAILGAPGSGRTTLISYLVHHLTDPSSNPVIDRLGRLVPLVLPLSAMDLGPSVRTVEGLLTRLSPLPFWVPGLDALLPELLDRGQALFIIDDLDSVEDPDTQDSLRDAILDAAWRYPGCGWVVTAEPGAYARAPLRDPEDELPAALSGSPAGARPEVPVWYLQPFAPAQIDAFGVRWGALMHPDRPGFPAELRGALGRSAPARALAGTPGMLALLALVMGARGDLPADRPTLLDWLVAAWLSVLDNVPEAHRFSRATRRAWVEALARAAEAERIAAWDPWIAAGAPGALEARVRTPPVPWEQATYLLRAAAVAEGEADPGPEPAARFVHGVGHRPGVLVGRGGGLAFARADQQRFLAAVHVVADLDEAESPRATRAALQTLTGWSRMGAPGDLDELFTLLDARPGLAGRVWGQLLDAAPAARSLGDLAALGPLALALRDAPDGRAPPEVRAAAGELVDVAVRRWAEERGKVPTWTRDLRALKGARGLPSLDLSGNPHIADLSPLAGQSALSHLDLVGCAAVADLSPLARLPALTWADIRDCPKVHDVSPIGNLPNLRWLDLSGCTGLTDLRPLGGLVGLQALALHGCTGLRDLGPLSALRGLRALVLSGCTGVQDLTPLRTLPPGGTLWLRGSGVRVVPDDLRWNLIGLRG